MAQQTLALELYDMINDLSFLSDDLIEVRAEALARVEGADEALADALEGFAEQLETLRTSLSASKGGIISGEERLRERLGTLYGNVTGYDGRPSKTQFDRRDTLGAELADALSAGEELLGPALEALNARLAEAGLEGLSTLDRDEWNEEEGMASFSDAVGKHFWRVSLPQGIQAFRVR